MTNQLIERPLPFNGVHDVPNWTLGDRMKRALRHADISVGDMAADLGVSPATMGRWLSDKGPVKRHIIRIWALTCGVDEDWLATGQPSDEALRARRDSNPKPSDWESAAPAWTVNQGLTLNRGYRDAWELAS